MIHSHLSNKLVKSAKRGIDSMHIDIDLSPMKWDMNSPRQNILHRPRVANQRASKNPSKGGQADLEAITIQIFDLIHGSISPRNHSQIGHYTLQDLSRNDGFMMPSGSGLENEVNIV